MELNIYQADAFASNVFEGNPAAVCPLELWLPDEILQKIAQENNLSETAFFVPEGDRFSLRWFTPEAEVDLCGHATLATAHIIFQHLYYPGQRIRFETKSGELVVEKAGLDYSMDFPASPPQSIKAPDTLIEALGTAPIEVLAAYDYVAVFESEEQIKAIAPDFPSLSKLDLRGVLITAPGESTDFVSRCFFPKLGIDEDPVTGSAHCELAPYWSKRLGKNRLMAKQLSTRTGMIGCEAREDRVVLTGKVADYLQGKITINT